MSLTENKDPRLQSDGLDKRGRRTRGWASAKTVTLSTVAVLLVLGYALPEIVGDTYYMSVFADSAILAIMALGIGFLGHHCGLLSIGHTAFYGLSAYSIAILTTRYGFGLLEAAIAALVIGTVVGTLVGLLIVRSNGMTFLMLTLAFGQAAYLSTIQQANYEFTGGFNGMMVSADASDSLLGLTQLDFGDAFTFWPYLWTILIVVLITLWAVGRSPLGRLLRAIRENEERTRFSGYNTYWPRVVAFALSALLASLAGTLFALRAGFVSPDILSFQSAADALIAALVGGVTTLLGPAVGSFLYVYGIGEFGSAGAITLYLGIALMVVIAFMPGGVTGTLLRVWHTIVGKIGRDGDVR